MNTSHLLLAVVLCATAVLAAVPEHRVKSIPGLHKMPPYVIFSGYVSPTEDHHLHYTFVKANVKDAMAAPLVLWLNGGPVRRRGRAMDRFAAHPHRRVARP